MNLSVLRLRISLIFPSIFFAYHVGNTFPKFSSIGLQKLGARKWIGSLLSFWGAVTGLIFLLKILNIYFAGSAFFWGYLTGFFGHGLLSCMLVPRLSNERGKSIVSSCYLLLLHRYWLRRCLVGSSVFEYPDYEGSWRWLCY